MPTLPPPAGLDPVAADARLLPAPMHARLITPALVIDLGRVRRNLASVLAVLGGDPDRWRPHVKTLKIPRLLAEVSRAGIRQFKCATVREARVLLETLRDEGIDAPDVLLAHPVAGPGLERLGALASSFRRARISVLAEDPAALDAIPGAIGIFVDVNVGMDRSGVPADRLEQILAVARGAGPRFGGIHAYEGHVKDADAEARGDAARAVFERLAAVIETVRRQTGAVPEVVTSGTPTFRLAARHDGLRAAGAARHRVSAGTVILTDARTEASLPDLGLVPAAVVVTRVVSHPARAIVTGDAGSKSIATDAGAPCCRVVGWPGLEPQTPSEEHLPFLVREGETPARGTLLELVPRHVCTTVNLAESALLVDGATSEAAPVAARAHDLLMDR